jgi:hypothetical protein
LFSGFAGSFQWESSWNIKFTILHLMPSFRNCISTLPICFHDMVLKHWGLISEPVVTHCSETPRLAFVYFSHAVLNC